MEPENASTSRRQVVGGVAAGPAVAFAAPAPAQQAGAPAEGVGQPAAQSPVISFRS